MKRKCLSCGMSFVLALGSSIYADVRESGEVVGIFNPEKVILASSQYTPEQPYTAAVWVYNNGTRYDNQYYNHIWATPAKDKGNHEWYEPEYTLTDGDGINWITASSPFSSDDTYKGQKSFRWVEADITGDIYIRRTFTLDSLPDGLLYLACGHDDAPAEWYINGVRVHSVSDGWDNDEYKVLTAEQKSLIKTDGSPNILAVHVHQNWGGAFADCGLYGADMSVSSTLLNTVSEGTWPCKYYMLNYNSDIEVAESVGWASENEDEDDWMEGYGPMSNDDNMFYVTEWASQVRPILIRRHFNVTYDDMSLLENGLLTLVCSYDENPKVYLNGNLIWRANGWSDNNYDSYILSEEQVEMLHEGDNTLAVSLSQGEGGGHIDYGLKITAPYEASGITPVLQEKPNDYTDSKIYNIHGQFLGRSLDNLPKGIYIVGGKKVKK